MAKVDEFHIQARRGPGCGSGHARTYTRATLDDEPRTPTHVSLGASSQSRPSVDV